MKIGYVTVDKELKNIGDAFDLFNDMFEKDSDVEVETMLGRSDVVIAYVNYLTLSNKTYIHVDADPYKVFKMLCDMRKKLKQKNDFELKKIEFKGIIKDPNVIYGWKELADDSFGDPEIEEIIFSGPATIVKFDDGDKVVVRNDYDICSMHDAKLGLMNAIAKKFGTKRGLENEVKKVFSKIDELEIFKNLKIWDSNYNEILEETIYYTIVVETCKDYFGTWDLDHELNQAILLRCKGISSIGDTSIDDAIKRLYGQKKAIRTKVKDLEK